MAELGDDSAEREIGGTEVVAPLADAVRLVDDEERHAYRLKQPQKSVVFEFFGRRIDDANVARGNALAGACFLIFGERRVERDDVGDSALAQHVELILHQRDQRADDDRGAFEQERRQLIGEALARSGRENGKRILASEDARNDLFLAGVKAGEAKLLLKRCAQIHGYRLSIPQMTKRRRLGSKTHNLLPDGLVATIPSGRRPETAC